MNANGQTGIPVAGMDPQHIRMLLADMTTGEIDDLIDVLPMASVTVITPPDTGLIMAKVRDCFDTDFFLGEILVTRTEVRYGDQRAQVTLVGNLPKHALAAAALEVLEKSGDTAAIRKAAQACRPAAERIDNARRTEAKLAAATRVQFESMAEEP